MALLLFAGAGPAWALNLTNNRPIVQETLAPGDAVQGSVELANNGAEPMRVKVYLEDWRYTSAGDGSKEFAAPGTFPRSAAGWVSVFPALVDLPAHGRGHVDYVIRAPKDQALDGGYYAVLFFESVIGQGRAERSAEPSAKVQFSARLGSLFLVEVNGSVRRQATLASLAVSPPSASTPLKLQSQLSNDGNTVLKCEGFFHLLGPSDLVAARGELPSRYLWPGSGAPIAAEWAGSLNPGSYTTVVTYDCGGELVVTSEADLVVR
ncbi:MAG: hypothetical protein HYZ92_00570 [Candidatus Omnitrophica bacterium]|nr:hypothetical protein [Candidatus Omnitrophota bacterium]